MPKINWKSMWPTFAATVVTSVVGALIGQYQQAKMIEDIGKQISDGVVDNINK